jgi:hypothetical protein
MPAGRKKGIPNRKPSKLRKDFGTLRGPYSKTKGRPLSRYLKKKLTRHRGPQPRWAPV